MLVQVGRADVGEVAFLRRVDVRGLDLDAIVTIEKGKILLYPEPASGDASPGAAADDSETPAQSRRRQKASVSSTTPAGATASEPPGATAVAPPKPPPGEGLNVPAMLTFRRMLVKQRDDSGAVARRVLQRVCHGWFVYNGCLGHVLTTCMYVGLDRAAAVGRAHQRLAGHAEVPLFILLMWIYP